MDKPSIVTEIIPFNPKESSELYIVQTRTPIPGAPPEAAEIHTDCNFKNFPSPMDVLNALEIAKALVIQSLVQAGQAQAQRNPNFPKPPWVKNRN